MQRQPDPDHAQAKQSIDCSVSMATASIVGLFIGLLPAVSLAWIYGALWGWERTPDLPEAHTSLPLFLAVLFGGAIWHELIHGLSWMWLGRLGLSTVHFGFHWRTLTPYAHLRTSIPVGAYAWGVALPGLLLGLLPAMIAMVNGSVALIVFGVAFTAVAGGDILVLMLLLWRARAGDDVIDHPTRIGCALLRRPS